MAGKINPSAATHAVFAIRIIPYKRSGDGLSQVAKQNAAEECGWGTPLETSRLLAATARYRDSRQPLGRA